METIQKICEEFKQLEKQLELCDTSSPLSTAAVMWSAGDFTFNKAPALIAEIERLQRENGQVESMNRALSLDGSNDRRYIIKLIEENAALQKRVEELGEESNRLKWILAQTEHETGATGQDSQFAVQLEYDNYHDGAVIKNAAGAVIASCYDDKEPDEQFRSAIDTARAQK